MPSDDDAVPTNATPRRILREVPRRGIGAVLADAAQLGYRSDDPTWCNLGQGQPEVGTLPAAPPRVGTIRIAASDHAYGPAAGVYELRQAVAAYYNRTYRSDLPDQYSAENVAITPGGRSALTRVFAAVEPGAVGCFSPDYPPYADIAGCVGGAAIRAVDLSPAGEFKPSLEMLEDSLDAADLRLIVRSNPCNPTGNVIRGAELASWVDLGRRAGRALVFDEHYSQYVYDGGSPVSAARHVQDVDEDPVLLIDGLTKNFRYPGWRLSWVVGPRTLIEPIASVGAFLDGGTCRFVQRPAIDILQPDAARRESNSIREAFAVKRDITVQRLLDIGLDVPARPAGTFYVFASVANLPSPLDHGREFHRAALDRKVITVPGDCFDLSQTLRDSTPPGYERFVRISFGSPLAELEDGLDRLAQLVRDASG